MSYIPPPATLTAPGPIGSGTPSTGAFTTLTASGATSVVGAGFGLSGNISAPAWLTAGVRYANVTGTMTDTTSSGTVAAARSDNFGGNTIAASSATTFSVYASAYFSNPIAGTNVTLTRGVALGADSIAIGPIGATGAAQGSSSAPALAIGQNNTGLYATSGTILDITAGGIQTARFSSNGWFFPVTAGHLDLSSGGFVGISSATAGAQNADVTLSRASAGVFQINNTNAAGAGGSLNLTNLTATGAVITLSGLPTADPHVVGVLWRNSGVVTVSAG